MIIRIGHIYDKVALDIRTPEAIKLWHKTFFRVRDKNNLNKTKAKEVWN